MASTISATPQPATGAFDILFVAPDDGLVDDALLETHRCHFAATPIEAGRLGEERRFDAIVLFPHRLSPDPDLDLLRTLASRHPHAALVVVSDRDEAEAAEAAFATGAHSYLLRPLSGRQLAISISGRLRQCRAHSEKVEHLRRFQRRVEQMMENAPVPMFLRDRRGRYLLANAALHRCMMLEPGVLIGETDDSVLPAEVSAELRASDAEVMASGDFHEDELTLNMKGVERTYETTRFPYFDGAGAVIGVFGIANDITDRKSAEAMRSAFAAEQRNLIFELQRSREETVDRLSRALLLRDAVSGEHVSRMATVAAYLGEQVGLEPEDVLLLRAAAPMHDIGKIAIRDDILRKRGSLDREERLEMERHALIGFELLDGSQSEVLRLGASIALTHHERFDGRGYPRGLRGEEIPIEGRIAKVADVFDALLSDRPYRPALPSDEVRGVIRDGCGTWFDPAVAGALLENFETALAVRNAPPRSD